MKFWLALFLLFPIVLTAQQQDKIVLQNETVYRGMLVSGFYPQNGELVIRTIADEVFYLPVADVKEAYSQSGERYVVFGDIFADKLPRLHKELLTTNTPLALYRGKEYTVLINRAGTPQLLNERNFKEILRQNTDRTNKEILNRIYKTPFRAAKIRQTLLFAFAQSAEAGVTATTTVLTLRKKLSFEFGGGLSRQQIRVATRDLSNVYQSEGTEDGYFLESIVHLNVMPYLSVNSGLRYTTMYGRAVYLGPNPTAGFPPSFFISELTALQIPLGLRYQSLLNKWQPFLSAKMVLSNFTGGRFYQTSRTQEPVELASKRTAFGFRLAAGAALEINEFGKIGLKFHYEVWDAEGRNAPTPIAGRNVGLGLYVEL